MYDIIFFLGLLFLCMLWWCAKSSHIITETEKPEYRVKELNGKFTIQKKKYVKYNMFAPKIESWYDVNLSGNAITLKDYLADKDFTGYGTIDIAFDRIKQMMSEPKFHYLEDTKEEIKTVSRMSNSSYFDY